MKTPDAVLLLLWLGLLLVAAESGGQHGGGAASTEQTCQPDIHTVLREMSTLIAEQRVELRHTKAQLEAMEKKAEIMETRLTASEAKAETMETRLRTSEKTIEEQRMELRQTKARLNVSERYVEQLKSENEAQAKSLNLTGSEVEELRRERQARRVSFSAALQTSEAGHTGPFPVATPLVYRYVITNVGDAYNPNTGVFTAPVRGVYLFFVFLHAGGHASNTAGVSLHKNGDHVVIAYAHQTSLSVNPSNGASLLLEVGDVVYVKLWPKAWVFDSNNHHTTFSGHLLFPM
ncbi:hypothetical protein ACEWY4_016313 [Coilia grayii]|uniref:C1q domain-containing protein n=1 Tax=Coilia grayii TaxID=363190 RepID=A0ABD1JK12_9TELE